LALHLKPGTLAQMVYSQGEAEREELRQVQQVSKGEFFGHQALCFGCPQHLIVAADEDQRDLLIGQVAGSLQPGSQVYRIVAFQWVCSGQKGSAVNERSGHSQELIGTCFYVIGEVSIRMLPLSFGQFAHPDRDSDGG
jgi:hypothetical protein